jgi:hypothetical protein
LEVSFTGDQCAVRFICVKDGGVDRHWKLGGKEKKEKKNGEMREE